MPLSNFVWGQFEGTYFIQVVEAVYSEAVHWRQNLFKVPHGRAGKDFVSELARLCRSYAESSALEPVALKAAMLMPLLLLQKPSASSKAKDHYKYLSRRLRTWHLGDLDSLVQEGRAIQHQLTHNPGNHPSKDTTARSFTKLMLRGKTRQALRLLTKEGGCI